MFRSVSTSRVSDDSYYSINNQSPTSKAVSPALRALALEANELPQYEPSPSSTTSKKDRFGRVRFSEKVVHLIPLVLLFCALVLWFFSNPDINMPIKNELIAARIKGGPKRHADKSATTRLENPHSDMVDLRISTHKGGHKLDTSLGN
ncbi:uncharacterized protein LOC112501424 [Cynara cardunculus var. scolymus]|uniref:Uncharacterized protein n=1 Tax=Cynara cardunculus var. scolymus TaxID=59895 RepID=A0A103YJ61_CYNCS|nr:uncharacterized protein LOC112501424 [Cynara cardunculus var. scolymus]KVI10079.1 hypothetical protein Ccrd_011546 [Cynara cardunculus var. scolymus]